MSFKGEAENVTTNVSDSLASVSADLETASASSVNLGGALTVLAGDLELVVSGAESAHTDASALLASLNGIAAAVAASDMSGGNKTTFTTAITDLTTLVADLDTLANSADTRQSSAAAAATAVDAITSVVDQAKTDVDAAKTAADESAASLETLHASMETTLTEIDQRYNDRPGIAGHVARARTINGVAA